MMPALGWASRPSVTRRGARHWVCSRGHTWAVRQRRKSCDTVFPWGTSWGQHRHGQPGRSPEKLALRMARHACWRGRPGFPAPGSSGSSRGHAPSVRAVGEGRRSMPGLDRLYLLLYPLFRQFLRSTLSMHAAEYSAAVKRSTRAGWSRPPLRYPRWHNGRDAIDRGAPGRWCRTRSGALGDPTPPCGRAGCGGQAGGPPSRARARRGPTRRAWSEPSRGRALGAGARLPGGPALRHRARPAASAACTTAGSRRASGVGWSSARPGARSVPVERAARPIDEGPRASLRGPRRPCWR
jgi:hypothetical protein